MNLRDLLEAGPVKANGIFTSLFETSSGAIKSREKIFNELKAELELYWDLVERQLYPLLKQHEQTKGLVPDAIKGNKELRAKLAKLDALPKTDEAFIPMLKELMSGFQQIVRVEKKELLPAVLQAVSEEQAAQNAASEKAAEEAARKAAAQKAAERARKAADKEAADKKAADKKAADKEAADKKAADKEAADKKAAEKKAAERAAEKAAEKKAAEQSRKAAERKAARATQKAADQRAAEQDRKATEQKAVERARKAAERQAAEGAARKAAERKAARAAQKAVEQKAARAAQKAVEQKAARARQRVVEQTVTAPQARDNAPNPGPDFHALAAFSMAATRGMTEMGSAWMDWFGGSSSAHAQLSQQFLRCRTMQELAQTQRSFFAGSAQGWMEHNARVLQISQQVAGEGLRALGGRRLGAVSQ